MVVVRLPVSRAVSDLEENTAQNVPKMYQISSPNVKTKQTACMQRSPKRTSDLGKGWFKTGWKGAEEGKIVV